MSLVFGLGIDVEPDPSRYLQLDRFSLYLICRSRVSHRAAMPEALHPVQPPKKDVLIGFKRRMSEPPSAADASRVLTNTQDSDKSRCPEQCVERVPDGVLATD